MRDKLYIGLDNGGGFSGPFTTKEINAGPQWAVRIDGKTKSNFP